MFLSCGGSGTFWHCLEAKAEKERFVAELANCYKECCDKSQTYSNRYIYRLVPLL